MLNTSIGRLFQSLSDASKGLYERLESGFQEMGIVERNLPGPLLGLGVLAVFNPHSLPDVAIGVVGLLAGLGIFAHAHRLGQPALEI